MNDISLFCIVWICVSYCSVLLSWIMFRPRHSQENLKGTLNSGSAKLKKNEASARQWQRVRSMSRLSAKQGTYEALFPYIISRHFYRVPHCSASSMAWTRCSIRFLFTLVHSSSLDQRFFHHIFQVFGTVRLATVVTGQVMPGQFQHLRRTKGVVIWCTLVNH